MDLSGAEGVLFIISDELGSLSSNLLVDIVDEGVHDAHGSLGDSSVWVDLLEDSVDIDGEGLGSLGLPLVDDLLFGGLGWCVSSGFSWHFIIQTDFYCYF